MRSGVCIALAALIAVAAAAATAGAEPQVRAYVQRTTVTVLSPFQFTIEVNGNNVGVPEIPEVEGLNINRRPKRSTSTQIQFDGTRSSMVQTQQFGYYIQATRAGAITIPAIPVQVDGQTLTTQPVTLTVVDNPQAAAPPSPPPAATPAQERSSTQANRQPTWEDVAYIESVVDKREVYQGEPIQLSLNLWRLMIAGLQVGPYRGQDMQPPTTDGFYATPIQVLPARKERNGFTYDVTQYTRTLYPTATGDLKIGGWHWEGGAVHGFEERPLKFDAPPINIKVKPLPERPANFSGAVGSFTVKALLERDQVVQGVPTQLAVRIAGRGNPDAIAAPPPPKLENAYVSDAESRPVETPNAETIEKVFVYTITPHTPGDLQVPAFSFCYFDPATQTYKTETTDPFTVKVLASTESTSRVLVRSEPSAEKSRVNVIGEDIRPLATPAGGLRPAHGSAAGTMAGYGLPMAAYIAFAAQMRWRRRLQSDVGWARSRSAKARLRKRLKYVQAAAEPSEELYKALTGFIADKLNVPEAGLTSADVRQLFESGGIDPELTEGFTRILRACERARYASAGLSADEVTALTDAALTAMDRIEGTLKGESRR